MVSITYKVHVMRYIGSGKINLNKYTISRDVQIKLFFFFIYCFKKLYLTISCWSELYF